MSRIETQILVSGSTLPTIYLWTPFSVLDLKTEIQRNVGLKTTRQSLLRENCTAILSNDYTFDDVCPCIRVGLCLLTHEEGDSFPSFQWDYHENPLHGYWGRASCSEVRIAPDFLTGRLSFVCPATVSGSVWHGWLEPDSFDGHIFKWIALLCLIGPEEKPWYGPGGGRAFPPNIEGKVRVGWLGADDALVLKLFNESETILHRDLSQGESRPSNVVPQYEERWSSIPPSPKAPHHRLWFCCHRFKPKRRVAGH